MFNFKFSGDINELVEVTKNFLDELKENAQYGAMDTAINATSGHLTKLEQIQKFLNVKEYRLVFMGEPGKGKTTAICNYLNLLKNEKIGEKTLDSVPLLSTGSGRTTVAEVRIKKTTDVSRLCIQYKPIDEQLEYIHQYCEYYWNMVRGESDNQDDINTQDGSGVHLEYDRVVRNMAGLEAPVSEKTTNEKVKVSWEKQFEHLSLFPTLDAFCQSVIETINLNKRQTDVINYDKSIEFENWLRRTFSDFNNGTRGDTSIASCITIEINRNNLDVYTPDSIEVSEVIDTIGIDGGARKDLHQLMRSEDTICIFCDDLKAPPSKNFKQLLGEAYPIEAGFKYNILKTSLLIKSPISELSRVNECDEDPDEGMRIKSSELDRKINSDRLPYSNNNTLFIDCCDPYRVESNREVVRDPKTKKPAFDEKGNKRYKTSSKITNYDEERAYEIRFEIDQKFQGIIDFLKSELKRDTDEIRESLISIQSNLPELADEIAAREFQRIKEEISSKKFYWIKNFAIRTDLSNIFYRSRTFSELLISYSISELHHSTIKALNRRYGNFNPDLYKRLSQAAANIIAEKFKYLLKDVCGILNTDSAIITDAIIGIKSSIVELMNQMIKEYDESMYNWTINQKFAPLNSNNSFWAEVNNIKGSGYKERVKNKYIEFLNESNDFLNKTLQDRCRTLIEYIEKQFTM